MPPFIMNPQQVANNVKQGPLGLVQQGQQAGFYNPNGSPLLMAAVRRGALRTADNQRRRSAILSRLMGLDPNQARVAAVNAEAQGSGDVSNALNSAQYGQLAGNQDWFRNLYMNRLQAADQERLAKMQQPGLGQQFGNLLGQGATAYFTGGFRR